MKKKTKSSKKEHHKTLKFFFLAVFIILLGAAILVSQQEQQAVAAYTPRKALQIGWFTIVRTVLSPRTPSNPISPQASPTPCPGGIHNINVNKATGQSQPVAMVPQQPPPVNNPPRIWIPPENSPAPQPQHEPCYTPPLQ